MGVVFEDSHASSSNPASSRSYMLVNAGNFFPFYADNHLIIFGVFMIKEHTATQMFFEEANFPNSITFRARVSH